MPDQGQQAGGNGKREPWTTGFEFEPFGAPSPTRTPEGGASGEAGEADQAPGKQPPDDKAPAEQAPTGQQVPDERPSPFKDPADQAPAEQQAPGDTASVEQGPAGLQTPPLGTPAAQTAPEGVAAQEAAGQEPPRPQEPSSPADVADPIPGTDHARDAEVPPAMPTEQSESDLGGVTELMVRAVPSAKERSMDPTIAAGPPRRPAGPPMAVGLGKDKHGTGSTLVTAGPAPSGEAALQAGEKISDTRLGDLAVESGMASTTAIKNCQQVMAARQGAGGPEHLGEALVSEGVLTEQQVHTLEQVAREGGKANLLGAYQLLEKLGEGGMGAVFKARQVALDRMVALKILPERLSRNAEFVGRFEREARAAAKLDHPNVVRAIDAGRASGKYYFAMEFVEGASIEDILEECEKVAEEKAIGIMIQAARGLESAWKHGLIHRDIKPDNILITNDGIAKIADLGLAREADTAEATRLTQDGAAMGTPHYISPEQARGEEVDIRTDIYALGVTLYRMVTGQFPFTGKDPVSIIMARFHETPTAANEICADVSDEIAQVIATMMAPDRELRYPDPVVLQHDLELVAQGEEPEYASSSEGLRQKALESARKRRSGTTTTFGAIVIKKRRGRERAFILGGAVVAAAIVVAVLTLAFRGKEEPAIQPAGAAAALAASEEELAARKQIEKEAADFYDKLKALLDGEEYAALVSEADAVGAKYAGTPSGPKIDSLRARAGAHIEELERRAAEEAEKGRRYGELVRQAREALELRDHATATTFLTQAKAIKDTQEVAALLKEARRLRYLVLGEEAERARRLEAAAGFYRSALELQQDDALRARVAEIDRLLALAKRTAEGDAATARRAWKNARTSYEGALELARDDERPPIEEKLAAVGVELAYLDLMEQALADAAAARWQDVLGGARKASGIKPEEAEPKELILRARRAIGPEKRTTDSVGIELVLVPAGEFTMGSETGQPDEGPPRRVRLDAYYVGVHEVTNAQYEEFRPRHPRTEYSPADDTPVVAVSWVDACAFCDWLSEREGTEYRLPTEAEWEYAARGSDGRTFPWGKEPGPVDGSDRRCVVATQEQREKWAEAGGVNAQEAKARAVGSCPSGAAPFGCMDMAGNVWEWCLDWYRGDHYASGEDSNPQGPAFGKHRVHRGGSFETTVESARCANRAGHPSGFMEASVGFRVVRALDAIFLASDEGGKDGNSP